MAAVLKHWREASTLILVSARHKPKKGSLPNVMPNFVNSVMHPDPESLKGADLEVLLLKRSSKSKFMPNLYVFPGGVASDADFSADWIPVFNLLGKDHRQDVFNFVQRGGQGAPMFSRLRDKRFAHIPSEIAFRICAIRETFEESGVLLVRRTRKGDNFRPPLWDRQSWASYYEDEESSAIHDWRQRVINDPSEFLHMCQELHVVPDVWSLYEWSNWLTPLEVRGKRRFDTAFFICCVDGKPSVAEDEGETVHSQWGSPYDIIHQYYLAKVGIAPPQLYELRRLMEFPSASELLRFAWHRGQHHVKRWLPVPVQCADAICFALPGDSLYPADVNPEGPVVPHTHSQTLAQLSASHANANRTQPILRGDQVDGEGLSHVVCNITLPAQHVAPRSTNQCGLGPSDSTASKL